MSNLKQCDGCGEWKRQWVVDEILEYVKPERGLCRKYLDADPAPQMYGNRFYDAISESQRSLAKEWRKKSEF